MQWKEGGGGGNVGRDFSRNSKLFVERYQKSSHIFVVAAGNKKNKYIMCCNNTSNRQQHRLCREQKTAWVKVVSKRTHKINTFQSESGKKLHRLFSSSFFLRLIDFSLADNTE